MGLNQFLFKDIGLGINTRADLYELRPGESSSASNIVPASRGQAIMRRDGLTVFNNLSPAVGLPIQTICEWPLRDKLVISQGNDIYWTTRLPGGAWTKIFDTAAAGNFPWCFELAKSGSGAELLWMVNGRDPPQHWDGVAAATTAWPVGIPPVGCTFLRLWKNRMVMGGDPLAPERLYYSSVGNPALPNPLNFIDLRSSYDDNDVLTWSELIGDNLLIFKKNSTWLIYDINTFANRRLGFPGCPATQLSANLNGVVYFIGAGSLWVTDGVVDPKPVDAKVEIGYLPSHVDTKSICLVADSIEQRLIFIKAFNNPDVWLYYPPNSFNNPRDEPTWWLTTTTNSLRAPATAVMSELSVGGILTPSLITGTFSGSIYRMFTNPTDDDGVPIVGGWSSGVIQFSELEKLERLRRVNLRLTPPVAFTIGNTVGTSSFSQNITSSDSSGYKRIRPEVRGREFQLIFQTIGTGSFTIRDIELMFRGGKAH